ncbi:MAG: AMP-binding protein, partial [Myxococcota bacterium]
MGLYERWAAAAAPERSAVVIGRETLRYGELHERVRRGCGWLRAHGLGPGDVLALAMPKEPAFLELVLACLRAGVVALPLNDRYTARELTWPLLDARVKVAVLPDALELDTGARIVRAGEVRRALDAAPAFDPPVPPDDATALLLYTSGTTGRPKGVPTTHAQVGATVDALRVAWGWRPDDVLLHALPHHHVHGLVVGAFGALAAGAGQIWLERFDAAEVLDHLARGPATVFMGVPTFHARLAREPARDLRRVRLVTSGSAGLPASVHQAFAERFGVQVVERYGMTEVGIVVSNPLTDPRPGWIGRPLPGVEVRVVDGGRDV